MIKKVKIFTECAETEKLRRRKRKSRINIKKVVKKKKSSYNMREIRNFVK